jgi:hypothetical protein
MMDDDPTLIVKKPQSYCLIRAVVNLDNIFLGDRIQWNIASTGPLIFLTHNNAQPYNKSLMKNVNYAFSIVNEKIDLNKAV